MTDQIWSDVDVVTAARAWIGTPYVHQASCRGAGTDCLGLIRGIWRSLNGTEPEVVPAYSHDWGEPQGEEVLLRAALRHLVPMTDDPLSSGQVLLFRMRDGSIAKHLGICSFVGASESAFFIHAYSGHAVAESPLSLPWRRRIAARFAFPKGV